MDQSIAHSRLAELGIGPTRVARRGRPAGLPTAPGYRCPSAPTSDNPRVGCAVGRQLLRGPPSGLGTALLTTGPVAGCRGRNGRPRPSIRPSATPYRGHHFAIWREVFNSTVSVTSADQAVGAAT